jgi:dolichyl-phosphate beta-glucosyltransferase
MVAHDVARERAEPTFSLIFPTYRATAFLAETWRRVDRFLGKVADWEVLFVCDGCAPSADCLRRLVPSDERVRVLSYLPNRGKGFAVRHGLREARGQYRLFTDVDLAYGFEDVLRVAEALRSGADAAIAARLHPESRLILPPGLQGYAYRRHLQSLVFSTLVQVLLPLKQRDTQAGLKGLSARTARLVLPELQCNGFGFDCELLVACQGHGLTVAEVPVTLSFESTSSTTSWRTMSKMVRELWAIRRRLRRGKQHAQSAEPGPQRRAA